MVNFNVMGMVYFVDMVATPKGFILRRGRLVEVRQIILSPAVIAAEYRVGGKSDRCMATPHNVAQTSPLSSSRCWASGQPSPADSTTRAIASFMVCENSTTNARHVEEPTQWLAALSRLTLEQSNQRVTQKTSVSVTTMRPGLDLNPNRDAASELLQGFSLGFIILFVFSDDPVFADNLKSAWENPGVLQDEVQTEVNLGRMEGPFKDFPFPILHVSPLGVIPKK